MSVPLSSVENPELEAQVRDFSIPPPSSILQGGAALARSEGKFRWAFAYSALAHVVSAVLILVLYHYLPKPDTHAFLLMNPPPHIVFLIEPGPGGGGGGGGNRQIQPPTLAKVPGKDKISIPVEKPPVLKEKPPKDEPKPQQQMNIPAKTLASAPVEVAGVLENPSAGPPSQGMGTGGGAGGGAGTGIGPGEGSGLGPGSGGGTGGGIYRPGSGVTMPRLLRTINPSYTPDAMRAKIQGTVILEVVVEKDGSVGEINVVSSLDRNFGLDEEAKRAVKMWRFVPSTRQGIPVAVWVTVEVSFNLH